MEKKFGPGSEFEKQMKKLGEEMKEKYGPDSEFAKRSQREGSRGQGQGERDVKLDASQSQAA